MKNIIENAKEIAGLIKKYNDQELYEKIVDLREQILELRNGNITSAKRIQELEESENIRKKLVWDPPYYWSNHNGQYGPYCQVCWDKDEKLVRLHDRKNDFWKCLVCKNSFQGKNYKPLPRIKLSELQ